MKKDNRKKDSWSLLASELGIENGSQNLAFEENEIFDESDIPKTSVELPAVLDSTDIENEEENNSVKKEDQTVVEAETNHETIKMTETEELSSFGAGILDNESPSPPLPKEQKKTLLGRFAKINLFGTPKNPAASMPVPQKTGMSFTSKTVEKVPLPSSRTIKPKSADKEEKSKEVMNQNEDSNVKETQATKESTLSSIADSLDPWSKIASQVGALPQRVSERQSLESSDVESSKTSVSHWKDRDRNDKKRGRKSMSSLFDDAERPENRESSAFQNLIDETEAKDEAEKRLESIFNDDESLNARPFHRNRTSKKERKKSAESSQNEKFVETRRPKESDQVKGRRGSRYVPDEVASFHEGAEEEVFVAWDIEEEPKPVERSTRGRQRGGKMEKSSRFEKRNRSENENRSRYDDESDQMDTIPVSIQKTIPSWDDAISIIIEANQARHSQRSGDSRKGRR